MIGGRLRQVNRKVFGVRKPVSYVIIEYLDQHDEWREVLGTGTCGDLEKAKKWIEAILPEEADEIIQEFERGFAPPLVSGSLPL